MVKLNKKGLVILVAGTIGLSGLIIGCGDRVVEYKSSQFFVDLNRDSKPEHIFMVNTGKNEDKTGDQGGIFKYNDFDLMVSEGKGEGNFGEPRFVHKFYMQPSEVKFEDITNNKYPDLIYLICTGKNEDKTSDGKGALYKYLDFDLMARENNGDGTFGEPRLIKRFSKEPVGLH